MSVFWIHVGRLTVKVSTMAQMKVGRRMLCRDFSTATTKANIGIHVTSVSFRFSHSGRAAGVYYSSP